MDILPLWCDNYMGAPGSSFLRALFLSATLSNANHLPCQANSCDIEFPKKEAHTHTHTLRLWMIDSISPSSSYQKTLPCMVRSKCMASHKITWRESSDGQWVLKMRCNLSDSPQQKNRSVPSKSFCMMLNSMWSLKDCRVSKNRWVLEEMGFQ